MNENEHPVSSAEAARLVGAALATMAVWRARGVGPPVHYCGEKPVYYPSELRAWMDACTAAMRAKHEQRAAEAAGNGGRRRGRPKGGVRPISA